MKTSLVIIGSGGNALDMLDVADALVCALERPDALCESFNLGAPEPFLVPEGARIVAEITGRRLLEEHFAFMIGDQDNIELSALQI